MQSLVSTPKRNYQFSLLRAFYVTTCAGVALAVLVNANWQPEVLLPVAGHALWLALLAHLAGFRRGLVIGVLIGLVATCSWQTSSYNPFVLLASFILTTACVSICVLWSAGSDRKLRITATASLAIFVLGGTFPFEFRWLNHLPIRWSPSLLVCELGIVTFCASMPWLVLWRKKSLGEKCYSPSWIDTAAWMIVGVSPFFTVAIPLAVLVNTALKNQARPTLESGLGLLFAGLFFLVLLGYVAMPMILVGLVVQWYRNRWHAAANLAAAGFLLALIAAYYRWLAA